MAAPRTPGAQDVVSAAALVGSAFGPAVGDDWARSAGALAWTSLEVLDHLIDTLVLYAAHLATSASRGLPALRRGEPGASPRRLLVELDAAAAVLAAVVASAPDTTLAFHPCGPADATGFAAMGVDELLVHAWDIGNGLDRPFIPPAELVAPVLVRLFPEVDRGVDPWAALLWANGRTTLPGRPQRSPEWTWTSSPHP